MLNLSTIHKRYILAILAQVSDTNPKKKLNQDETKLDVINKSNLDQSPISEDEGGILSITSYLFIEIALSLPSQFVHFVSRHAIELQNKWWNRSMLRVAPMSSSDIREYRKTKDSIFTSFYNIESVHRTDETVSQVYITLLCRMVLKTAIDDKFTTFPPFRLDEKNFFLPCAIPGFPDWTPLDFLEESDCAEVRSHYSADHATLVWFFFIFFLFFFMIKSSF